MPELDRPKIILGLMTFAPDEITGARLTKLDDLKSALDIFHGRGYTELDTARAYGGGTQEGVSRQAGWKEKGFSIATKFWPLEPGFHKPEVITEMFETSLKELGTDFVDIAYLHAPDRSIPFAPALQALDALHKAGKFGRLGLSNYSSFEVAEIVLTCHHNNWVRPTIYQGIYNVMNRAIEGELIPACRRYGLDIVVYSPIVGGFLTGQVTDKNAKPTEGRFSNNFFGGKLRDVYFTDANFEAVAEIKAAADRLGITPVEIALRWLRWHSKLRVDGKSGGNDGIIIGISKLEHLDQNIDGLEKGPLPDEIVEALDRMYRIAKPDVAPYWMWELEYGYDTLGTLFGEGK